MKVYHFDMKNADSFESVVPHLSEQRRALCENIKNENSRMQSAYAYVLLRLALKRGYGITEPPEFTFGERGKPFLKDRSDVFFNMSHCKNAVICAVSDSPVGVDIQDIRPLKISAAKKFCTESELLEAEKLSDEEQTRFLCRLWSIKESVSKMTGVGFAQGYCGFSAEEMTDSGTAAITEHNGNIISICGGSTIEIIEIDKETLFC